MIARLRRDEALDADRAAAAVAALASSIRSGSAPRRAVEEWHAVLPPDLAAAVAPVCRRLVLGGDTTGTLAGARRLGPAGPGVARCLRLHACIGGSLPALLDELAAGLRRSHEERGRSRAATAGARLSGRLVAGLPFACIPLMPGARLGGSIGGIVLVAVGVALAAAGLWWIGKLVPAPAGEDPAAAFASGLAVALDAGAGLVPALDALAAMPQPGLEHAIARVRRKVTLGGTWMTALTEAGGTLGRVGLVVRRSAACGLPAAAPLREWAEARRAEVRADFDRGVQRAPVLMVVPLTACVLPSFALLAFGPFLLGALEGH